MSKLEVNAVEPQCGTNLTLGASGDTIIIPSGATISNQGTAAGFGPTGAVSWDTTKKTTGFTAVSGVGYFCDTTSAAFTVTFPATPAAGAVVGITDYANTFATNNLTVGRNGSNIGGVAANATLSTNGIAVTFVYVDATQGWIVTDSGNRSDLPAPQFITATGGTILTCGDYKSHVFTGPGTFTVSSAGNSLGSNSVEYLVVAGGGGGAASLSSTGNCASGGAGGAGGYRQNYPSPVSAGLPVTATGYPITVGAGGPGTAPGNDNGTTGSNSIFSTITSTGGGGGGAAAKIALNGGSGGGGGYGQSGGTGNTPPVSPSQGNNGGSGGSSPNYGGGGGGGAGATGPNGQPTAGGTGGAGSPIATTVFGPTAPSYGTPGPAPGRYFAGGGGGGVYQGGTAGAGGAGGGGAGGTAGGDNPGNNATTNTGGGGGGATKQSTNTSGGNGGSGIVVIRYKFQ